MVAAARDLRQSATASEQMLWQALRGGKIRGAKFRRQHPIGPFVVDFCCPARRLIIEIDGEVHEHQRERDCERQLFLESWSYHLIRVTPTDVEQSLPGVIDTIAAALSEPK